MLWYYKYNLLRRSMLDLECRINDCSDHSPGFGPGKLPSLSEALVKQYAGSEGLEADPTNETKITEK
jgi:hypothetical protein